MKYQIKTSDGTQEFALLSQVNEALEKMDPDTIFELHKNGVLQSANHFDLPASTKKPYEKPAVIAERQLKAGESLESDSVVEFGNASAHDNGTTQEEAETCSETEAKGQAEDSDSSSD